MKSTKKKNTSKDLSLVCDEGYGEILLSYITSYEARIVNNVKVKTIEIDANFSIDGVDFDDKGLSIHPGVSARETYDNWFNSIMRRSNTLPEIEVLSLNMNFKPDPIFKNCKLYKKGD